MATKYWFGGAIPIPEVKSYVFTGTWATGDTATITINGKSLTLTAGVTATVTQLAEDMIDMINGESANGTETRSALGTSVGEFSNLTASAGPTGQVWLTGQSNGRPIGTVTPTESTVGNGTFTAVGGPPDTTGTGPNFYSNAANWSGGSIPVDSDDVVFDHQACGSCLYGLAQTTVTPTSVTITKGFKYSIGLPEVNRDDQSHPYDEHQDTYLQYDGATTVTIDGSGAQGIKIDAGTKQSAFVVQGSGTAVEVGTPPVLLKGSHASNTMSIATGVVGYCFESGVAGTLTSVFVGGGQSPSLEIGSGVTVTTMNQTSGTVVNRSTNTLATLNISGGTFEHRGAAITTANVYVGATLIYSTSASLGTLYLVGGTLDANKDARAKTISNCHIYAASSFVDPLGSVTFSAGYKLYCKPSEVRMDLPARKTYTLGVI